MCEQQPLTWKCCKMSFDNLTQRSTLSVEFVPVDFRGVTCFPLSATSWEEFLLFNGFSTSLLE